MPASTVPGLAATVPLRTLVTNSVVIAPLVTDVMSHGPLIGAPAISPTTSPQGLSTISAPAVIVAEVPSVVGRLPTIT